MKFFLPMTCGVFLGLHGGCGRDTSVSPAGKDSRSSKITIDRKKGESKLVGTWTFLRSSDGRKPDWGTTLDFRPDGKVAMRAAGYANQGTYSLAKNILKIDATVSYSFTVAKLTDKELALQAQLEPTSTSTFEYRKE